MQCDEPLNALELVVSELAAAQRRRLHWHVRHQAVREAVPAGSAGSKGVLGLHACPGAGMSCTHMPGAKQCQ